MTRGRDEVDRPGIVGNAGAGFGRLIGDMTDPRVIMFGLISLGLLGFGIRDALAH